MYNNGDLIDPFLQLPWIVELESFRGYCIARLTALLSCKSQISFHHLPVPSIKIPSSLLAIICKVLDNTETGSGDTNHCDDNPVGDESLEGDAHFVRGGAV